MRVLSEALTEKAPLDRWMRVCSKIVSKAEQGERWAVEWLGRHALGDATLKSAMVPSEWRMFHTERQTFSLHEVTEEAASSSVVEADGVMAVRLPTDMASTIMTLALLRTREKTELAKEEDQDGQVIEDVQD